MIRDFSLVFLLLISDRRNLHRDSRRDTEQNVPCPPRTIKTQTPAQKRPPKEKYELQNEEELSVAMVRKNLGRLALTRSQGRNGVGPGLGYGLSSNVRRHDNAIRHYCRANPVIADN